MFVPVRRLPTGTATEWISVSAAPQTEDEAKPSPSTLSRQTSSPLRCTTTPSSRRTSRRSSASRSTSGTSKVARSRVVTTPSAVVVASLPSPKPSGAGPLAQPESSKPGSVHPAGSVPSSR